MITHKITYVDVEATIITDKKGSGDIYDHLQELYSKVIETQAKIVVELGTRGGVSSKAFLAGVHETGGLVVSIDCDPLEILFDPKLNSWIQRQGDSREFEWMGLCWDLGLTKRREGDTPQGLSLDHMLDFMRGIAKAGYEDTKIIDVLFIDTDHTFDTTTKELAHWEPFIRVGGYILCHDTIHHWGNDPSIGGYGVLQPILNMLEANPDRFEFEHREYCNGLGVIRKVK